jgi:hypothetical protein
MHAPIAEFKERFGIGKIAGCMMLHYFKWPWCLEELAGYVDEIYLLLHYSSGFEADWPKRVPRLKRVTEIHFEKELTRIQFRAEGNREKFREKTIRMLDLVGPDLVLFPDEDEMFPEPELLAADLERFYGSRHRQLAFRRTNFWDSMDMVRSDRWIHYHGAHVRVFKWQPGLTYTPYLGYNRVSSYGKRRMKARTVMRHYAFLRKEDREWRYNVLFRGQEKNYRNLLTEPKLVKYTDARTAPRT